ncbi:MAG: agmatine deiminase family protein, partial [Rhodoluna sp.]
MSDWKMPAEWQPHAKTWMAWPSAGYTLGETESEKLAARNVWSSVANAVVRFEPVTVLCEYRDFDIAREFLDDRVELIACELNDAWMRDIGPT